MGERVFGFLKKKRPIEQAAPALAANPAPVHLNAWGDPGTTNSGAIDDVLRLRVAEAVTWCESLSSSADLRSEALKPSLFHDGPEYVVSDLGLRRRQQLRDLGLQVRYDAPILAKGKFMLYFPDDTLADGCAELVSGGFFDVDNLPAYDTWVTFVSEDGSQPASARRYLLCYVPTWAIDAADAGIEVNPESCIVWLEQSHVSVRRQVQAITSLA